MSVDSRPVVGIVGHGYVVTRPFGELAVAGTTQAYVDAVAAVGCRPVVLPSASAAELVDVVDGLVLTGGGDVDPELYGGDPELGVDVDRRRDDHELALVQAAARAGVPVLGVCRGLHLLVVAFGGSLTGVIGHIRPHDGHDVATAPGSMLCNLVGSRSHTSALHHQALADAGPRWRATAWTDDGTVEAVEWAAGDWPALAVQWHPELAWSGEIDDPTGPAVFGWLTAAATRRRAGRRSQPPEASRAPEWRRDATSGISALPAP